MRSIWSSNLLRRCTASTNSQIARQIVRRGFQASAHRLVVKPFLLADIGEGIRECEIIQWFVEPGARVEEWDKLCEVQSDKASVEITNRYAGVIKKLHYEAGDMAKVGKPLIDIDIQADIKEEDLEGVGEVEKPPSPKAEPKEEMKTTTDKAKLEKPNVSKGKHASLATPAVRHLTKELNVNIEDVNGSGKDGRVSKEDVYKFVEEREAPSSSSNTAAHSSFRPQSSTASPGQQVETPVSLSNIQTQMFKTMTRSLAIPHFLYADEIDFSRLSQIRSQLNSALARSPVPGVTKVSYLPYIIKAASLAIEQYPILNARVLIPEDNSQPSIIYRSQHNIGVAIDTPQGLLVPVIKDVAALSILDIARELSRLQGLASASKLSAQDLAGGTFTISNIGSIGGTYVSPICVEREVAILGIGRTRTVPAFNTEGLVVPKQVCNFSWSADHRVLDGATIARAGEVVRKFVEEPETMLVRMR